MFAKSRNLVLFVMLMTAETCFARHMLTSSRVRPPDKNKICQDELGADYVWEENVRTCVRCTSCTPEAQDPHCVTCRELGVIPTVQSSLSGITAPQPDVQSSTKLQPSSAMTYSSATGMDSTSQATGMGSTSQTNDDNKGSEARGGPYWIIPICLIVAVIVVILIGCGLWMFKYKKKATLTPMSQQETGLPSEFHPMVGLPTDDTGNHTAEDV
ncbi:uncharacterized protein LOC117292781 [Asterias rubens]|uniref:uncharacterized protein LOC117292781 n=1 Tax=Asterias rubens TaxID=7604 RepID=UPI001454FD8C|nr:uncharacterized protein LOC117292781 [Asterias rubens]